MCCNLTKQLYEPEYITYICKYIRSISYAVKQRGLMQYNIMPASVGCRYAFCNLVANTISRFSVRCFRRPHLYCLCYFVHLIK